MDFGIQSFPSKALASKIMQLIDMLSSSAAILLVSSTCAQLGGFVFRQMLLPLVAGVGFGVPSLCRSPDSRPDMRESYVCKLLTVLAGPYCGQGPGRSSGQQTAYFAWRWDIPSAS